MTDAPDPLPADDRPDPAVLTRAAAGLAVVAVLGGCGQHLARALVDHLQDPQAWAWAGAHLLAALASLPLGYLAIARAYPLPGLLRAAPVNPAAALQAGAHLLAAGAVATVAWGGIDGTSFGVSAAFWALGILAIVLIAAGHRRLTRYHDHEEIAAGNTAAALASAGLHGAIALVVMQAIQGDFAGWRPALTGFGLTLGWCLLLLPLRQLLLCRALLSLRPRDLDAAVAGRRDPWLAGAEALTYLLTALAALVWI